MKRGLPAGGADAPRAAASRASAGRGTSARAPRWHSPLLWLLMLASVPAINPHVRSDGNEYYAYVRSLVIDHDLHFDNEYAHAEATFQEAEEGELSIAPTGYRRNIASVGPSLMWTPFFLAAHAAVHVMQERGSPVPADGFSWPYLWACAFGSAFYAFLGLWMSYRLALRFAAPTPALGAVIVIWLASSVPVYLYFLPFHAHAIGVFTTALFLTWWLRVREGSGSRGAWFLWGVWGGLVFAVYYLNAIVMLAALVECVRRVVRPRGFRDAVTDGACFALGAALVMAPALLIKGILEGRLFATGYGDQIFYWRDPRLYAVLFSPEHGAFLWTPVLLLAALGLPLLIRRQPAVGSVLVATALLFYYAVAAYRGWHGFSSYGSRFLTALTPIAACGLAALADAAMGRSSRPRAWATAAAGVLLIVWNAGFMLQWGTNIIPNRGPVDMRQVVHNQVTVVPRAGVDFLHRYFTERSAAVRAIEAADERERQGVQYKR